MLSVQTTSLDNVREYFPEITYKYRDWSNPHHKTIITEQQVFFSPPSAFWEMGDEHDCRFPIEWDFSYDASRGALDRLFPEDRSGIRPKDFEILLKQRHYFNVGTPERQARFIDNYYELSNRRLGVLSITGRNDNLEIWQSPYANDFTGFCVGIDFKACLQELAKANIGGGEIKYVPRDHPSFKYVSASTRPDDEVMSLHIELIHTKYVEYQFEEEYRLTQRYYMDPFDAPIPKEARLFRVPRQCYKSVTFGYLMPKASRQEIVQACTFQGLNVEYFVATPTEASAVIVEPYATEAVG